MNELVYSYTTSQSIDYITEWVKNDKGETEKRKFIVGEDGVKYLIKV